VSSTPAAAPAAAGAAPTRLAGLAERLGTGAEGGPATTRLAWRLVLGASLLYALSFAAFYPDVATNVDEAEYIRQSVLLADGRTTFERIDPFTDQAEVVLPTTYSPGFAFLAAPLVALGGWRATFLVSLGGLLAAVLFTARWLADEGRSPLFALLVLGFLPSLVMGRVAMTDVPSAGCVALGLWLFWRGIDGGAGWWLASGFVAGSSMVVRASNPVILAPLFAGTVLRREPRCVALVAGGLLGLGVRFASMWWFFGDPLYERRAYPFSPGSIDERLLLYALGLLVLVPGGLILSLLYKGRRRPELVTTVALFVLFYLLQKFSSRHSGEAKRLVLSLRYLIPLVPVLAFNMAEVVPRLWRRLLAAAPAARRAWLERAGALALSAWIAGVGVAALAVHPAFAVWGATQVELRNAITEHVPLDAVLVTNWPATRKFLRELDRQYTTVQRHQTQPARVTELARRHGEVYLVLLDRSDSATWLRDREANAAFEAGLHAPHELLLDRQFSATDRLRIWRVRSPSAGDAPPRGRRG
jgi:hypothetical protein